MCIRDSRGTGHLLDVPIYLHLLFEVRFAREAVSNLGVRRHADNIRSDSHQRHAWALQLDRNFSLHVPDVPDNLRDSA